MVAEDDRMRAQAWSSLCLVVRTLKYYVLLQLQFLIPALLLLVLGYQKNQYHILCVLHEEVRLLVAVQVFGNYLFVLYFKHA